MTRKVLLLQAALLAAALAATAVLYPRLPERVATHWGWSGQPDGYSAKIMLFFFGPGLIAVAMLMTAALPWLSPRRFEVASFGATYGRVMCYLAVMFAYIDVVTLALSAGVRIDAGRAILGGACLFIALIGNVLGKVRRNFYIGVRTPWTLADERVWNATHRLAAKCFVAAGALGLLFAVLGMVRLIVFLLLAGALAPVIYSLVYYKRLERHGELANGGTLEEGNGPRGR